MIDASPASVFMTALAVYREAAGEPELGKIAVAWVIRNRAESPGWWGDDPYSVVTCREQFSSITHQGDPMTVKWPPLEDRVFQGCLQIASDVLQGARPDPTGGADHYCTASVAARTVWANPARLVKQIGHHNFYVLGRDPGQRREVAQ